MGELNAIEKAFSSLFFYHTFFCAFLIIPFLINLYSLFTYKNFASLNKKIWHAMPLIFFLLLVALLSGINVSITQSNFLSPSVIAMWIYWFFVLSGEIFRIKTLKIARRTSEEAMLRYIKLCKWLYICNLLGLALIYLLV